MTQEARRGTETRMGLVGGKKSLGHYPDQLDFTNLIFILNVYINTYLSYS